MLSFDLDARRGFLSQKKYVRCLTSKWPFPHDVSKGRRLQGMQPCNMPSWRLVWPELWNLREPRDVERRHGKPIKFLFLPKTGLLGSQAGYEKKCWLWIMSNFWRLFFHVFMGKNYYYYSKSHCRVHTEKLLYTKVDFFELGSIFGGLKIVFLGLAVLVSE